MSQPPDLLRSRWALLLWWLPTAVIVIGGVDIRVGNADYPGNTWHTMLWTGSFAVIGVSCLVNARRCGRRHCYYTGPLYVGLAAASLLFGMGFLPLGPHGWEMIALAAVVGALVFWCVMENVAGRYRSVR